MVDITEAYLEWSYVTSAEGVAVPRNPVPAESGEYSIHVVDTFSKLQNFSPCFLTKFSPAYYDMSLTILPTDKTIVSTIVHQGYIPSNPLMPSVCITIQSLKLYPIAHLCSPHLSIQAFVKTLCDLHSVSPAFSIIVDFACQVEFCCYLSRQFSIALDVYLNIQCCVDHLVQVQLNHN